MSARIAQRTRVVYGGLILLWVLTLAWQAFEHRRFRRIARAELVNRARDISNTLGVVIRSQRRFGWLIFKEGLESAFNSLIKRGDLEAIALLNDAEEIVASAGAPIPLALNKLVPSSEYWAAETVALMNLVDLGTNETDEAESRRTTIVLPSFGTNRPPGPLPPRRRDAEDDRPRERREAGPGVEGDRDDTHGDTNTVSRGRGGRSRRDGRAPFGRPWWMDEHEYRELVQKQGVHSFVLLLSTRSMQAGTQQDLWARSIISAFATVAAIGLGLAWWNLTRSSDLEVRLARAAELNARLKEMNLAAAGLAHETRNPLNIIRGLAQLISRQPAAPAEVHAKSRDIIAETDRVTAQLNEFINYSRPREVRWSHVFLGSVVQEVVRALGTDLEERAIRLQVMPDLPAIEGDEQLIRQALFNLLLNAIQAVDQGGSIEVTFERTGPARGALEVRDDGHGVLPEHHAEIFKPYFTTHAKGTGLGLAIVHQIVLAHGWEIDCRPNSPKGAVFRLSHLKINRP